MKKIKKIVTQKDSIPRQAITGSRSSGQSGTNPLQPSRHGHSGLPNLGNTCYLNALFQVLASCLRFIDFIKSVSFQSYLDSLANIAIELYTTFNKY